MALTADISTDKRTRELFTARVEVSGGFIRRVKVWADKDAPIIDVDDAAWDVLSDAGYEPVFTMGII